MTKPFFRNAPSRDMFVSIIDNSKVGIILTKKQAVDVKNIIEDAIAMKCYFLERDRGTAWEDERDSITLQCYTETLKLFDNMPEVDP